MQQVYCCWTDPASTSLMRVHHLPFGDLAGIESKLEANRAFLYVRQQTQHDSLQESPLLSTT